MQSNKKILLTTVGMAILIIGLVGVTFAFFNYTRTGTANIIRTGRIAFDSTQGTAINLTNLFPVDVSEGIPNDNTKVGTLTINITGDTEYTGGIEYLVTAVNVQNTVGTKQLPISIDVSVGSNTGNNPVTTLGTADDDYFTVRGDDTSYYKVLASDVIKNNEQLVVGYIAPGQDGVDGNIIIKAYIDADKIAISDTYYENATVTPSPTAPNDQYGTTTEWVDGRVVLTTNEWNSLQTNGVSFQIKVEAQEDTWVIQEGTIDSCPGCYFMYTENQYHFGTNASTLADIDNNNETYSTNYKDIVFRNSNTLSYVNNQFLGFTINNGTIDKAYVCGVAGNTNNLTPFCIEGIKNGTANTQSNKDLIMSVFSSAYNPNNIYTCIDHSSDEIDYHCENEEHENIYACWSDHSSSRYFECESSMDDLGPYNSITFWDNEWVDVGNGYDHDCYINNSGEFFCVDETN